MSTVRAVFEDGVFHPKGPVNLPDHAEVEFEPRVVDRACGDPVMDDVYAVLSERYESGERDVAARHNEHQP